MMYCNISLMVLFMLKHFQKKKSWTSEPGPNLTVRSKGFVYPILRHCAHNRNGRSNMNYAIIVITSLQSQLHLWSHINTGHKTFTPHRLWHWLVERVKNLSPKLYFISFYCKEFEKFHWVRKDSELRCFSVFDLNVAFGDSTQSMVLCEWSLK